MVTVTVKQITETCRNVIGKSKGQREPRGSRNLRAGPSGFIKSKRCEDQTGVYLPRPRFAFNYSLSARAGSEKGDPTMKSPKSLGRGLFCRIPLFGSSYGGTVIYLLHLLDGAEGHCFLSASRCACPSGFTCCLSFGFVDENNQSVVINMKFEKRNEPDVNVHICRQINREGEREREEHNYKTNWTSKA